MVKYFDDVKEKVYIDGANRDIALKVERKGMPLDITIPRSSIPQSGPSSVVIPYADQTVVQVNDVVKGSPAEKAGIKGGDIVVATDGVHIASMEQLIDYIRTTVVHAVGISHLRKIASLAELYQVRTGCHGATDMSPVCMAAALHFDLSVHNFGIQEYMRHTPETDQVFPHAYTFTDGAMHPGEKPGLGVDIDEALAAKYPYHRAYLPVNRKLDGTMHSW
jgi:hypothetical protein